MEEQSTQHIMRPLYEVKGWLKFLGIVHIVTGALQCLTIIGALFGWIPLWIGILSLKTANNLGEAEDTDDAAAARTGLQNLGLIIKILGIFAIIGVCLSLAYVLIAGIAIFGALITGLAQS
ncbi:MAG: hypothetical protein GF333_07120 [Candidatus Omnitrophica bacterium]|nr:hypothetical protein [Candidatus Omnitrophota bacterium]